MTPWTWVAASRRGTSHERTNTKRQDAFRVLLAPDGNTIIVVACDGAGSAICGGQGANIAARTISSLAKDAFTNDGNELSDDTAWQWIDAARDRIAAVADRRSLSPRDFATTLVVAISDGASTFALHVGDGAAVCRAKATGQWNAISWPEHGEYASTTFFLTDEHGVRARITRCDIPIDRIAVFTDGIERLALDFGTCLPHAPFFNGVTDPVAASISKGCDVSLSSQLGKYLDSDSINARTDDDKTLIIAALS